MPTSVPSLAKVAILESAPDTLISVSVLCRKGLEVFFKYTEGPAIYLQGELIHQGTFDHSNKMFSINILDLLNTSIRFLLVQASGIMLQNPVFILRITPLAPATFKSSLTRLKNAIITMRPRARSELLSVALLDPIALSLSSFLVKVLAHGSVMMCENTRSLPKALLLNWRRSLSVPSSAKTGPRFSFRVQPPQD